MARTIPEESQVLDWLDSLKNWGRWGSDDQLGCLNFIGPEQRRRAVSLVSEGVTVSCARPITTEMTPDVTYQVQRFMVDSGEGRDTDPPERRYTRRGAGEFIGMVFHGQTITHIDAMSHYSWNGLMYNGVPSSLITSREGAQSHKHRGRLRGHRHPRRPARPPGGQGRGLARPQRAGNAGRPGGGGKGPGRPLGRR